MKLAIIGNGFVGSNVAKEALKRGWSVLRINRDTPIDTVNEADAVVHTVGAFMEDQTYKKLVSSPITPCTVWKLLKIRLGDRNPMNYTSFINGNFKPAIEAAKAIKPRQKKIPFIYISASDSPVAEKGYIESKRMAENVLGGMVHIRAVFLRPGFIGERVPKPLTYMFTPRNLVDNALKLANFDLRVSVESVAEAACDAAEDNNIEGVVECDAIKAMDQ